MPEKRKYYCEIILNHGKLKELMGRTGLSKKTDTPEWGEAFKLQIPEHSSSIKIVLKTIISLWTVKKEETVGEIKIPMITLYEKGKLEKQFKFSTTKGDSSSEYFKIIIILSF